MSLSRTLAVRFLTLLLALAACLVPAAARAGAPIGPALGNVRYRTAVSSATDADDFVGALVAGEALSVSVAAERRSGLVPRVTVLDPSGRDRTPAAPALSVRRGGASLTIRKLPIDLTGRWAVRVEGERATTGSYSVRFRIRKAPAVVFRAQRLEDGASLDRGHPVDAVEGARLRAALRVRRGGEDVSIGALADPAGAPVALSAARRRGSVTTLEIASLAAGDGAYVVTVESKEARAVYDLTLRVDVPSRPRGSVVLSPEEPRLQLVAHPIAGSSAAAVRLLGANFSLSPRPTVWFGTRRASVLQVALLGGALDIAPPRAEEGTVVDVAVVNPDGQAVVMTDYFRYALPEPPVLAKLTPATASVYTGDSIEYWVTLSRPAPIGGASVRLVAAGALGDLPSSVLIGSSKKTGTFTLIAAPAAALGQIEASYGELTLRAEVAVVERPVPPGGGGEPEPPPPLPDEIDVSGWTLVQANSARSFTIPAGTKLRQGAYLIVARATTVTAFTGYWGVPVGADVVFLSNDPTNTSTSTDDWPSINGSETFELRDAAGVTIDGPTAAMGSAGGENWNRTAGKPAGVASSWTISTSIGPGGAPTPGGGQPTQAARHGVYISEFSDTSGSGNYVHEFVELHFDGHPPQ
jgi:hypothetical protein